VVAAAPYVPFPGGAYDLVIDRGCLHLLDPSMWADYFAEASRVLASDGHMFLIEAGGAWRSMEDIATRHFALVGVTQSSILRKGSPMPMANVTLKKRGPQPAR
jgi:hypothetical protein